MMVVDSKGVAVRINDSGISSERPPSGRKVRAARRNGRKGKGKKTAAGKRRSAQNSMKHGVLSSGREPIRRGPFEEDPQEHREKIDLIVASLQPRNPVETRIAEEIAGLFICADRLGVLETANLEGDSRLSEIQRDYFGSTDTYAELEGQARGLYYFLVGAADHDQPPYRDYANLMRFHGPKPGCKIPGVWDDDHEPATDEDWEKAHRYLLKKFWKTTTEAAVWAYKASKKFGDEWSAREGREREIIAAKSLDGTIDKVTRYRSRVLTDLRRFFELYWALQNPPSV